MITRALINLNPLSANILKTLTFSHGMLKYPQKWIVFIVDYLKQISNLKIIQSIYIKTDGSL